MGGAMPLFVLILGAFMAWLMWSSQSAKETFLFCMTGAAFLMIAAQVLYHVARWLFS